MLTIVAIVALALMAWSILSLVAGIVVGSLLRRGQPPADVRRHPAPPRLVQPAA
ncbi:hypothetical protein JOE61_001511 [Nocardioides salarius]|uniref:Uncharacterized protein n=1 Tax=Nocardioides salarius TaxID=374513 RepID=A0ABS2M925_9ACTN|nr:hypothetical protein [Nocardioides salarius]MBM7507697.1 hypothetical protein [Nocardioides salarius]